METSNPKQANIKVAPTDVSLKSPDTFAHQRAITVWHSFGYAIAGISYVFRTQRNAQIHLGVSLFIVGLGLFLDISLMQWAALLAMIGLVLSAEMYNTVIEAIVDLVSPDFHPLAKVAKDVAAGTVFLLAIISAIVGLLILGPPLWQYLFDLLAY